MSDKKQIEEKKKIISDLCPFYRHYGTCDQCDTELEIDDEPCYFECMANVIINNGYRKQEWISVDERLPDEDIRVLVYINSDRSYTKIDTDRFSKGTWVRWYEDVTHWMPLPEAPKGE